MMGISAEELRQALSEVPPQSKIFVKIIPNRTASAIFYPVLRAELRRPHQIGKGVYVVFLMPPANGELEGAECLTD